MNSWEAELAEDYAKHLVKLAWAFGNPVLQRGWWPYVDGELRELERKHAGIRNNALAELKKLREQNNTP